jgi:hypothetical protein
MGRIDHSKLSGISSHQNKQRHVVRNLTSYGSRRMDSGALDEDLEDTSILYESINFCLEV